mmetsp:Transcript_17777/g.49755  ORF Transcript_17777/g.49755 Transcript_17777/m.49755 type:complete len:213 (-) Transcript_17777:1171-1809(-)
MQGSLDVAGCLCSASTNEIPDGPAGRRLHPLLQVLYVGPCCAAIGVGNAQSALSAPSEVDPNHSIGSEPSTSPSDAEPHCVAFACSASTSAATMARLGTENGRKSSSESQAESIMVPEPSAVEADPPLAEARHSDRRHAPCLPSATTAPEVAARPVITPSRFTASQMMSILDVQFAWGGDGGGMGRSAATSGRWHCSALLSLNNGPPIAKRL